MYLVYYSDDTHTDEILYSSEATDRRMLITSGQITFELNKAGSFEFSITPENVVASYISVLKGRIRVEFNYKTIWMGRVASIDRDFYGQKSILCEGLMSMYNDVLLAPTAEEETWEKITDLINRATSELSKVHSGEYGIRVSFETAAIGDKMVKHNATDWLSGKDVVMGEILDKNYCYSLIRYDDSKSPRTELYFFINPLAYNGNGITFGTNLLDLSEATDAAEVYTILLPLGKDALTIEEVNGGDKFLYLQDLRAIYGDIYKKVDFTEAETAEALKQLADNYNRSTLEKLVTLEISAIDLDAFGIDAEAMEVGKTVHVFSIPHNLDANSMCSKIVLDIVNPESSQYSFGLYRNVVTGSVSDSHADIARQAIEIAKLNKSLEETQAELEQTESNLAETNTTVQANYDDLMDKIRDANEYTNDVATSLTNHMEVFGQFRSMVDDEIVEIWAAINSGGGEV